MMKLKISKRIRKQAQNPNTFLRINRAEYGSTFRKNFDFDNFYPNIDPLFEAASKFYQIPKKLYLCGSICSTKLYEDIKHLFKE